MALKSFFSFLFYLIFSFFQYTAAQSGNELLSSVIAKMNGLQSLKARINIDGTLTGELYYQRPYNIHVKLSDGRIISANKNIIWVYSPSRMIAGRQDLRGGTGGISGLLSGYESVTSSGNRLTLKSNTKAYSEIVVVVSPDHLIRSIRMKRKGSESSKTINLSISATNIGLPSNLFNFHPPSSAQIVENPLNQKE